MTEDEQPDHRRAWLYFAGGAVLVAAAVAPVVACTFFGVSFNGDVGEFAVCVEGHPLRFPLTILIVGVLFIGSGVMAWRER